ncbi:phosphate ABC transporter substrate-binding protein, PhoT family [Kytococcus aerolatus]|uniref:Phosphate ABC transporter substrate-binding protein, PhoT family n=1 Tax=Kytococcus aerolatus TaxID=592308 RepID=A0A212U7T3_9MICO|nr:phosphate ABC transporter substrate-binding protein PstS [Kytococcus aerolatus]SNC74313.1 phosphate ABC transporter substrate-binding protein, PhoT family [Kytococcus aerolatus]
MKINRIGSLVALTAASSLTLVACGGDAEETGESATSAAESPAEGEGEESPAEGEGEESPAEGEGEESPAEGEGEESPAEGEGEESPAEGEGEESPAEGEGEEGAAGGSYPEYKPAEGLSGDLKGVGSSAQEAAVKAWISGYNEQQSGVTVNYSPDGSGAGVEQFLGGATPWAGSDVALDDEEMEKAKKVCGDEGAMNLPAYISPIAIAYNLEGVDELKLKPETIAKIFNGDIEKWNDEAIAADNEGVELPDQEITVVHRSDESGTTANFQDYLVDAAGDAWPHESSKEWPASGEGAKGTSGVVSTVQGTPGTIGYADASAIGQLNTVHVGVGEEFVEYSPEAAAKVVDGSEPVEGRPEGDLALELNREAEGAYPVVLVAYEVVCKQYDKAEDADNVKDFLTYVASEEAQQKAADEAGSAPISADTAAKIAKSVESISAKG